MDNLVVIMNPKDDERIQPDAPETEVQIPHEEPEAPPVTAPPLPIAEMPTTPEPVPTPEPTPPAEQPPPPIMIDKYQTEERRWPMVLLYLILALLIATAVVFGGRWVYQKVTGDDEKQPTGGQQGEAPPPPTSEQQPTAAGPSGSGSPAPATPSGQLPNNGPGEVLALFVGVTLAVAGLHYIYQLRRP